VQLPIACLSLKKQRFGSLNRALESNLKLSSLILTSFPIAKEQNFSDSFENLTKC
jgi:hypothetical protein